MIRSRLLAGAACLLALPLGTALPVSLAAQEVSPPMYPETRSDGIVETIFGKEVADPYRWLENDVRNDPEVAEWVAAQNRVTDAYLATLPGNEWFKQKLGALLDYERFGIPEKAGSRYFYTRNSGLQNQSPLYVQDSLDSERRLLLDPNAWAQDGATALSDWTPSPEGKYLLYSVQDGGTDWRILRVLDVDTGEQLTDEIKWAKFTGLAWVVEEGFLYSRFPEPEEGQDFQALNYNQAVYYHKLGTPQSEDQLVFATPDQPKRGNGAGVTDDGRWAVISSSFGTDSKDEINVIDLAARDGNGWQPRLLVPGFENAWRPIGAVDGTMYFVTNEDAPRYKLVSINLDQPGAEWKVVVPETDQPIDGASIVGEKLVLTYLKDATTRAAVFALDGTPQSDIELGALGTAGGFGGEYGDPETFYTFTSFNQPGAIYRLNIGTGEKTAFATPELTFDPEKYSVEQQFYTSKDGTRVPLFIVRNTALAATNTAAPTMLYGYGGFDISLTPGFSATAMAWLEAGGVYAVANIRGGGEYGKEWHDGGRLANKQNVFDDFIAAGEYLKAQGITTSDGLAIRGGSNGGLLVGAVTNQRPDLVDAAQAAVGVMDMLRFDRWTAGRYWVDDYGYPSKEADFQTLLTYSPYHNIRSGVEYPPVLVTTADTDDRVVPGHSFKYTAALQAADAGDKPHLIRIETRAGHGSGKPTDKVIEEGADVLSFLARWTGLTVPPAGAE
ncbi:prolyl oligopeptidase family serine peptidase [Allopontixanthobacter sp.]|uniref:prolyl oligopeptidase family serine peptidase n=1 Tax=Allopontixanthobacter sp. TaxID=2906452 RepID=UPI002ABA105D|nr:prolyl oligopeptidase family serine peptidase [Allopontixanthobacter sp.]MDZ4307767.1 prolyl oligopeptidase family serine peptidase [Allopontixanthobacter sp.]